MDGLVRSFDCNNLIAFCTKHLAECETTDTAKTINSNFN